MRLRSLILFLVICLVGYLGAGPFLTLNSIKNAVETSDSVQLSEDIDFPAVRQNIKEQFSTAMTSKAESELSDNSFAALAVAFSDKLVEGILDTFVTPTGITSLLSGENPLSKKADSQTENEKSQQQQLADLWENSRFSYESIDRFSIWVKGENGAEVRVVLKRDGLKWRVTNFVLPDDLLEK
ncbi:MAG: DUF2939 domain-containing protein [Betaproteobacteria bacterium]|jgi:hypothetical protein